MGNEVPTDLPQEETLNNPARTRFVNQYTVYSFNERIYKNLLPGMFVGAGVFIELNRNIKTLGEHTYTPLDVYSSFTNYNPNRYNNNGLMFNWQYMTRDNPNSAYKGRSEEHTSELQSRENLVCRLLLEKKKKKDKNIT